MNQHLSRRGPEAGSAYIIALLVIVVLTIVGLSLSLVTQTESLIGANELTAERVFYTSDSGGPLAVARVLTVNSSVDETAIEAVRRMQFHFLDKEITGGGGTVPIVIDTEVTPFVPIRDTYCDGCPAGIGDVTLRSVNHAVAATSVRRVGNLTQARSNVYEMVGLQPWWEPHWESINTDEPYDDLRQTTPGTYNP